MWLAGGAVVTNGATFAVKGTGEAPGLAELPVDTCGMVIAIATAAEQERFMPFADELIGAHTAKALINVMTEVSSGNEPFRTLRAAIGEASTGTLRERSDVLRDALLLDIPGDYEYFASVIRAARNGEHDFAGWLIWPVTSAVAVKAIEDGGTDAFDDAMSLLAELTGRLTSEFAIRALLNHDLDRALGFVLTWTKSPDHHVRRLASEGTRPFLPWSRQVPAILANPQVTLPIINALYRDDSEYVRRSVGNHLNDLSRQHPDIVIETAAAWLAEPDKHTARLVRNGLRTLVKKGHRGALELLGFTKPESIDVAGPVLSAAQVSFGGTIGFTATITNTSRSEVRLAVDYIVHHMKANGRQSGKTFKLTTMTLAPGEQRQLARDHSFREITTRRYYPGEHAIELQVNGVITGRGEFTLCP